VAAELGIGIRALQAGFRRQVGYSPRQYLIRCRLDLARARLLSPAPLDTVSSIAIDCGFLNLGLFASRYRRTYGELPSQTLAGSRR
jgi:AraC-like DNA-binding protein